ncbi:MAG TPA: NAD-dependent epimerase/dehydratase family protein, partial [Acidimicrobiales bacterium]|nr:NAD-dependent epimerase/dehydratase family protein [Acidimicrobiales bacterium]
MSRIAVTGAAGPVGRRVCALLLADPDVDRVVAIDRQRVHLPPGTDRSRLETRRVHLKDADLDVLLAGADTVLHLAGSDPLEGTPVDHDLTTTSRVLAAADRCGVGQVVVRTSATVYGAWADNPLPITEGAPLRPNDETPWVQVRASIEARVQEFADTHPDVAVAVLRPCVTVSEDGPDELGRVLAAARVVAPADDAPPAQFVHVDDVASAVDVVRRARARGAFNVAPDGGVEAPRIGALVGGAPRLSLPPWLARRLTDLGWRYGVAPTPPGFLPFVTEPWVVASDRLRELGWEPSLSGDEAFVAGHAAAPWAQISPKRRQELALGVAA